MKPALINYYARLIRKDQMTLEEIAPAYHEAVQAAIKRMEEAADKNSAPSGDQNN